MNSDLIYIIHINGTLQFLFFFTFAIVHIENMVNAIELNLRL